MVSRASALLLAFFGSVLGGCSSVGSSAVRTGPLQEAPTTGPVAIYAGGLQPVGPTLGVIEVHGSNEEGAIDGLIPEVVKRVQQLGGDAAVIDDVQAYFEILNTSRVEIYSYPCGYRHVCSGSHYYPAWNEVMTVTIRAHAVKMERGPAS